MNRTTRMWQCGLSLLLFSNFTMADWSAINMTEGVTAISRIVYDLHMLIFYVCVVIGIIVFGTMIISMLMHRKSIGAKPASFHENTRLEIAWTIIPILILVVIAVPATSTLRSMYDASESDIDIEVRGYQWKWQYTYLVDGSDNPADGSDNPADGSDNPADGSNNEIQFMSVLRTPRDEINNIASKGEHYLLDVDKPLVIPVNKRIRFLVTAQDVIHSFWVPAFAVKKDAIPGFVHEAWTVVEEPGIYRGQCAELCGKDHGFMPIVVHAMEQQEYDAWVVERQEEARIAFATFGREWTMDELMSKGEAVYTQNCIACHQPNGQGLPPAFPSLVNQGLSMGPLADHADIVLHGKAGTAMQAFGAQLNAAELAAVITYERNAWGNDMGDFIQPKEVTALLTGDE